MSGRNRGAGECEHGRRLDVACLACDPEERLEAAVDTTPLRRRVAVALGVPPRRVMLATMTVDGMPGQIAWVAGASVRGFLDRTKTFAVSTTAALAVAHLEALVRARGSRETP